MNIEQRLTDKNIRPTSNRILVLRTIMEHDHPVSLANIEEELDTLEKSSIFRVLSLFAEAGLVHAIEDGSGSVKYEICNAPDKHQESDIHPHFHCRECRRTFCFDSIPVPPIEIPAGFQPEYVNYMVKGLCEECASKI